MADTLAAISNEASTSQSQFASIAGLNPSGKVLVSLSYKMTAGNPATDFTLYTVPTGKRLVVTKVMTGKSNATTQDVVLYDSSGNTAANAKVYIFCPDWANAVHTYGYSPGVIFDKGITIDSTNQTVGHHYYFDIQGYLI